TQKQAEAGIALSTEHEFPELLAWATLMRGWALAEQGQGGEGIAQIRQGLAAWRAMGVEGGHPRFLALLLAALGKTGKTEEVPLVLAEALATVSRTGEYLSGTELYRLKGELTPKQFGVRGPAPAPQEEAEACFLKAINIARQQQAKSLELRAVMSLSRLWRQQGKQKEAHALLSEIYGWFTEGFDTTDLQEAKALLDELTSQRECRSNPQGEN